MRYLDDEARNIIEQIATGNKIPKVIHCSQNELGEFNHYWVLNGFDPISNKIMGVAINVCSPTNDKSIT